MGYDKVDRVPAGMGQELIEKILAYPASQRPDDPPPPNDTPPASSEVPF